MKLKATTIEVIFLVLVVLVIGIKFAGLFTYKDSLLPGWDTVPHFYLFEKFLELAQGGTINGYDAGQLGGSTLFYFYGPLPFFIGALITFVAGAAITDFFAWRLFLFLVIIAFPLVFWFFAKTFVHRKVGWLAILLALFYLFYPQIFRGFGIGASAVLTGGLFTSSLGALFSLLFFACLEKTRETKKRVYVVCSILSFAATVLSSPMIAVFLAFLWVVYVLSIRNKNWLSVQAAIFVYGVLLVLFFALPIVVFNFYQSAKPQSFLNAGGLLIDLAAPFLSLLTQYKNAAAPFASVWNSFLFAASLIIFIFFVYGFNRLRKNEKYRALRNLFIAVIVLQIASNFFVHLFPGLTVHYYRSSPFFLSFYFAIALLGMYSALEEGHLLRIPKKGVVAGITVMAICIGAWVFGSRFDRETTFVSPVLGLEENLGVAAYHFRPEDYPDYSLAQEVVSRVLREKTQRIFVEGDMYQIHRLGSPLMITTLLNLKGRSTLNGLLYESAHQSDFLLPLSHGVSHALLWGYTDNSLIYDFDLITQFRENIDRLRLMGVDYFLVHSVDAIERLNLLGDQIEEVARFGEEKREVPPGFQYALLQYRLYRLKNPAPLVRASERPTGLFVDTSFFSAESFKKFSIELFRRRGSYNLPVAFAKNISSVSPGELSAFDFFLITPGSTHDADLVTALGRTRKPVIIYNRFDESMYSFLTSMERHAKDAVPLADIKAFGDTRIRFESPATGTVPWIVNLGNFPDWRSERTVFEVTPGQMLLVSSGPETVNMDFERSGFETIANIISFLALLGLPFFAVFVERKFLSIEAGPR